MFNHEAYNARLAQIRTVIQMAVDDMPAGVWLTWEADVSLRYSRFIAQRSFEQMERAIQAFGGYEIVANKQKHREYCANEIMGVVAGMHAASAMMRGAVKCADPIGAEAMMRVYNEANGGDCGACRLILRGVFASPANSSGQPIGWKVLG